LSAINESFRTQVGTGTSVNWPNRSSIIGAPRNDVVTAQIDQIEGSIGYIEYFFATSTNTPVALLQNASGEFVAPGEESGKAALAGAVVNGDDLRVWVTDPGFPLVPTRRVGTRKHRLSALAGTLIAC